LRASNPTHAFAVPSDLHRIVTVCEQRDERLPPTLRQLVLGSGPAGRSLLKRLSSVLSGDTQVRCLYGLTEMAPVACVDMPEKLDWSDQGDLVGSPLPGCNVRLSAQGELMVAGDRLCRRYLRGEALSEVGTGDLARFDASRIVLLGRSKDMIIRGRANIYPALYEESIASIPGVSRAVMVGLWDAEREDERVLLVVEPTPAENNPGALRRRVEEALQTGAIIDSLALPDEVVVMPLPESGRTHKVDRSELRRALGSRTV
jgi:acyl-CoA synthetase (AMP-forming)/AMP-acid ligase II